MGLLDIFKKREKKGSSLTILNGRAQLLTTDTRKYIENGMLKNAQLYSIVSFLAQKFASVPIYEYRVKDKKKLKQYLLITSGAVTKASLDKALFLRHKALDEAMEDTKMSKLLQRPNSMQGQQAFFELAYMFKLLTGDAFMYANRGDWQETVLPPAALQILPSQFMNIVGDGSLYGVDHYYLQLHNIQKIAKENVLQWKYQNPAFQTNGQHLYGLSPLKSAAITLDASNAGKEALHSLFRNGGAATLLTRKDQYEYTAEQMAQLRQMMEDMINGYNNKGRTEVTNASLDAISLGMSATDLQLLQGLDFTFKDMCNVYGVDYLIFDNNAATYNNKIIAQRNLITNKIAPEWSGLRDELNRWLVPMFYGKDAKSVYLDFDVNALPEMQDDLEKTIGLLKQMDWLTWNEKRKGSQYEEIADNPIMNEILVPTGYEMLRDLGSKPNDVTNDTQVVS